MKLLDSSSVCDFLGISKSTLYRWCGVSDDPFTQGGVGVSDEFKKEIKDRISKKLGTSTAYGVGLANPLFQRGAGSDETPSDFPRPFKIGRSFKWKDEEIMAWLESRRV